MEGATADLFGSSMTASKFAIEMNDAKSLNALTLIEKLQGVYNLYLGRIRMGRPDPISIAPDEQETLSDLSSPSNFESVMLHQWKDGYENPKKSSFLNLLSLHLECLTIVY